MLIIADCMLVPVQGDLDITTVDSVRRHVDHLIEGGCKSIIMDLAKTDFVDSSGMGFILATSQKMRRNGGLLSLTNASENLLHAFAISRLADFIPCTPRHTSTEQVPPLVPGVSPTWRMTIRIDSDGLGKARERLREMLSTLPFTEQEIFDLTLAAGEAMGNAILHTEEGTGYMTVAAYEDRLVMEAVDDGPGYEISPDEVPETTLEHGRGIKIMRLLVDQVEIARKPEGHGTVARMVKLFNTDRQKDQMLAAADA